MEIRKHKSVEKYLGKLDKPTKERIEKGLFGLLENPMRGDIVPLVNREPLLRLRIGDYRIIFCVTDNINVLDIASRGQIYNKK